MQMEVEVQAELDSLMVRNMGDGLRGKGTFKLPRSPSHLSFSFSSRESLTSLPLSFRFSAQSLVSGRFEIDDLPIQVTFDVDSKSFDSRWLSL